MSHHCKLAIILPLFLLILTACADNDDQGTGSAIISTSTSTPISTSTSRPLTTPTQDSLVESGGIQSVIFTAEQITASKHWPNSVDPWTPSEADITVFEEQLSGYLQEENPALGQKLGDYTRQYWGTVTPNGNRAIYANFFCDADRIAERLDWREDFVMVLDGGDCYFQTLYDIEEGDFVWLAINGEA